MSETQIPFVATAAPARSTPAERSQPSEHTLEAEIDFTRYVHVVKRGWKFVAAGALVGTVAGLCAGALRPTLYEAATTVSIEHSNAQGAATFRGVLQGSTLIAETVREVGLEAQISPETFLSRHVQIDPVPGTDLVKVTVRLTDPAQAAAASMTLARKAVELSARMALSIDGAQNAQLQAAVDSAVVNLRKAEEALLKYQKDQQLEVLRADTDAMLAERRNLLKLQLDIASEKARLDAASRAMSREQPVLALSGHSPAARESTGSNVGGGSGTSDDAKAFPNPMYEALAAQVATSRTRLAALEQQRREDVDVRKLDAPRFDKLNDLYRREIEISRLKADHEAATRVYTDLAVRREHSKADTAASTVRIVDPAVVPREPLPRRLVESMVAGLIAGSLLAGLAALIAASGRQTG